MSIRRGAARTVAPTPTRLQIRTTKHRGIPPFRVVCSVPLYAVSSPDSLLAVRRRPTRRSRRNKGRGGGRGCGCRGDGWSWGARWRLREEGGEEALGLGPLQLQVRGRRRPLRQGCELLQARQELWALLAALPRSPFPPSSPIYFFPNWLWRVAWWPCRQICRPIGRQDRYLLSLAN